ncbi:hypothetical protein RJ639_009500 [Escallonia herrerae]|uniref:Dynamin-related protein 4C-like n=1 Tax=Escallonia herrerae TaxID=1293975 RepID=A0AA88VSE9_9ASTE|nr:hypothetical protein RJ639_009500 [Escallonia herrerae]
MEENEEKKVDSLARKLSGVLLQTWRVGRKSLTANMARLGFSSMEENEEKKVDSLARKLSGVSCDAHAPLVSSYNDRIRPLLDAVDELRRLKVMQEGIQLPTIVVVGDQSSGKSSVLESLAGISLPRGQGICTRVPLIMRLQNLPDHLLQPELHLEFRGKTISTDEAHVSEAINLATDEIAGDGKGISQTPLTLVVKKNGVPDLTMVDLPGITRVPVHGQPQDIYEQISNIIMEYIKPEESIILNVLSATVDFPTCESIRMSQQVDKTGQRTLAVVTKADKAPEGLFEKVASNDVNIGLGYVCVRNRIGEESYNEARMEEARLFEAHQLLARIDKSMVGIPVLARRLVHVQAMIISKCLPDIVKKIKDKLSANLSELNRMPRHISSVAEAMTAYVQVIGLSKESLKKILMTGEFDDYPDDKEMHCTARLAEVLNNYSEQLQKSTVVDGTDGNFLMEEIKVLKETKAMWLPNFVPRSAFLAVLQRKVNKISDTPVELIAKVWNYIEKVVTEVLMHHCENYPQLHSSTRRAAQSLVAKMKDKSTERVLEMVEMEKLTDYTCDPEYVTLWSKLMENNNAFTEIMNDYSEPTTLHIEGFVEIEVGHLRAFPKDIRDQAFDIKMRVTAYWKIVLKRLVDSMALHLLLSVRNLVGKELEVEMVNEAMSPDNGGGIERMLEESPSVAKKREGLQKSVKLLKDSQNVIAMIMDKSAINAD